MNEKIAIGPLPTSVFQEILAECAERGLLAGDKPELFAKAFLEEAALRGWTRLNEQDAKSWIKLF